MSMNSSNTKKTLPEIVNGYEDQIKEQLTFYQKTKEKLDKLKKTLNHPVYKQRTVDTTISALEGALVLIHRYREDIKKETPVSTEREWANAIDLTVRSPLMAAIEFKNLIEQSNYEAKFKEEAVAEEKKQKEMKKNLSDFTKKAKQVEESLTALQTLIKDRYLQGTKLDTLVLKAIADLNIAKTKLSSKDINEVALKEAGILLEGISNNLNKITTDQLIDKAVEEKKAQLEASKKSVEAPKQPSIATDQQPKASPQPQQNTTSKKSSDNVAPSSTDVQIPIPNFQSTNIYQPPNFQNTNNYRPPNFQNPVSNVNFRNTNLSESEVIKNKLRINKDRISELTQQLEAETNTQARAVLYQNIKRELRNQNALHFEAKKIMINSSDDPFLHFNEELKVLEPQIKRNRELLKFLQNSLDNYDKLENFPQSKVELGASIEKTKEELTKQLQQETRFVKELAQYRKGEYKKETKYYHDRVKDYESTLNAIDQLSTQFALGKINTTELINKIHALQINPIYKMETEENLRRNDKKDAQIAILNLLGHDIHMLHLDASVQEKELEKLSGYSPTQEALRNTTIPQMIEHLNRLQSEFDQKHQLSEIVPYPASAQYNDLSLIHKTYNRLLDNIEKINDLTDRYARRDSIRTTLDKWLDEKENLYVYLQDQTKLENAHEKMREANTLTVSLEGNLNRAKETLRIKQSIGADASPEKDYIKTLEKALAKKELEKAEIKKEINSLSKSLEMTRKWASFNPKVPEALVANDAVIASQTVVASTRALGLTRLKPLTQLNTLPEVDEEIQNLNSALEMVDLAIKVQSDDTRLERKDIPRAEKEEPGAEEAAKQYKTTIQDYMRLYHSHEQRIRVLNELIDRHKKRDDIAPKFRLFSEQRALLKKINASLDEMDKIEKKLNGLIPLYNRKMEEAEQEKMGIDDTNTAFKTIGDLRRAVYKQSTQRNQEGNITKVGKISEEKRDNILHELDKLIKFDDRDYLNEKEHRDKIQSIDNSIAAAKQEIARYTGNPQEPLAHEHLNNLEGKYFTNRNTSANALNWQPLAEVLSTLSNAQLNKRLQYLNTTMRGIFLDQLHEAQNAYDMAPHAQFDAFEEKQQPLWDLKKDAETKLLQARQNLADFDHHIVKSYQNQININNGIIENELTPRLQRLESEKQQLQTPYDGEANKNVENAQQAYQFLYANLKEEFPKEMFSDVLTKLSEKVNEKADNAHKITADATSFGIYRSKKHGAIAKDLDKKELDAHYETLIQAAYAQSSLAQHSTAILAAVQSNIDNINKSLLQWKCELYSFREKALKDLEKLDANSDKKEFDAINKQIAKADELISLLNKTENNMIAVDKLHGEEAQNMLFACFGRMNTDGNEGIAKYLQETTPPEANALDEMGALGQHTASEAKKQEYDYYRRSDVVNKDTVWIGNKIRIPATDPFDKALDLPVVTVPKYNERSGLLTHNLVLPGKMSVETGGEKKEYPGRAVVNSVAHIQADGVEIAGVPNIQIALTMLLNFMNEPRFDPTKPLLINTDEKKLPKELAKTMVILCELMVQEQEKDKKHKGGERLFSKTNLLPQSYSLVGPGAAQADSYKPDAKQLELMQKTLRDPKNNLLIDLGLGASKQTLQKMEEQRPVTSHTPVIKR